MAKKKKERKKVDGEIGSAEGSVFEVSQNIIYK